MGHSSASLQNSGGQDCVSVSKEVTSCLHSSRFENTTRGNKHPHVFSHTFFQTLGYDPSLLQIKDHYKVLVSARKMYLEPLIQRGLHNYHQVCSYNVCSLGRRVCYIFIKIAKTSAWLRHSSLVPKFSLFFLTLYLCTHIRVRKRKGEPGSTVVAFILCRNVSY